MEVHDSCDRTEMFQDNSRILHQSFSYLKSILLNGNETSIVSLVNTWTMKLSLAKIEFIVMLYFIRYVRKWINDQKIEKKFLQEFLNPGYAVKM